jgi:hypothetical protein
MLAAFPWVQPIAKPDAKIQTISRDDVAVEGAYFVEEVAVTWEVGGLAAAIAGLLFRPLYWAACWSVVLPVRSYRDPCFGDLGS